jgi:DnaJ-class molecular chaperone
LSNSEKFDGIREQPPIDETQEWESFGKIPEPCPACGGAGGSVSDGACELCQGSGVDPEDPLSPI